MRNAIIIHILKECSLACNLCYFSSPKRSNPIKKSEIGDLVRKGLLIHPKDLTRFVNKIPKNYEIFLRGGEVSLYPNWSSLFFSFAKNGHKITIDTNGQWIPKNEKEISNRFFEILKELKHKNITIYLSVDRWHEEKDPFLKSRTKIFLKYAEQYGLNFYIFSTGLKEYEFKNYYGDLNINFHKIKLNPNIYKLGRRKNDPTAIEYCDFKENEILVIDSNGDAYPCLKSCSEGNFELKLGNIKEDSINNLISKSKQVDCNSCINRRIWKKVIPANYLDKHMLAIGQAETNAKIIEKFLKDFPLKSKAKILVPGCGTGQLFDYINRDIFENIHLTFTDINKEYLEKLKIRLRKFQKIKYDIWEDDIENTKIKQNFDICIIILLLEHVNWKKAIANIFNFNPKSIFFIIQKQNKNKQIITKYKNIPQSIIEFSKTVKTQVVSEIELSSYLLKEGFNLIKRYEQKVINNKSMVGMFFLN